MDFLQLFKISLYSRKILIVGQNIGCNIDLYTMLMGKGDSLPNLIIRKISGFGSEAEGLSAQIYCVSSRKLQPFSAHPDCLPESEVLSLSWFSPQYFYT